MGDLVRLPSTYIYMFYGAYHILPCLGILEVQVLSSVTDCVLSEGIVWALYLSVTQCGPTGSVFKTMTLLLFVLIIIVIVVVIIILIVIVSWLVVWTL